MVKSTIIARVADGLPLTASTDDEEAAQTDRERLKDYKSQAKMLFKRLSSSSETRCSVESGPYVFHYLIEFGVCYLCICERSYPKKLAFSYLEELQREFQERYGNEVGTVARPYALMKFDSFMQKTKRQYQDTKATKNLNKLNDDLNDVTRIMTKNIQDVLGRGENLDRMSTLSQSLNEQSKKYYKDAKKLNWIAIWQKYGPPSMVILVVMLVLYIRFWWW